MDPDGNNWDQLLPHTLFAVRKVPQATTAGMSKVRPAGQSWHGVNLIRLPYENVLFMARQPTTVAISLFTTWWQHHSGASHIHNPHEPDPSPPQVG